MAACKRSDAAASECGCGRRSGRRRLATPPATRRVPARPATSALALAEFFLPVHPALCALLDTNPCCVRIPCAAALPVGLVPSRLPQPPLNRAPACRCLPLLLSPHHFQPCTVRCIAVCHEGPREGLLFGSPARSARWRPASATRADRGLLSPGTSPIAATDPLHGLCVWRPLLLAATASVCQLRRGLLHSPLRRSPGPSPCSPVPTHNSYSRRGGGEAARAMRC